MSQDPNYRSGVDAERDPLADFIDTHRADFDAEPPPSRIWDAVDAHLGTASTNEEACRPAPSKLRVVARRYGRQLAAASVLLLAGVLLGMLLQSRTTEAVAVSRESLATKTAELDAYYGPQINQRLARVASYRPEPALARDLDELLASSSYPESELLQLDPDAQRFVLEAMAQAYEAKVDALERILSRLQASRSEREFRRAGSGRLTEEL